MSFNFNYGGMGGYGDNSWLKNANQGNNQQPTTDDANAFNAELTNYWSGDAINNIGWNELSGFPFANTFTNSQDAFNGITTGGIGGITTGGIGGITTGGIGGITIGGIGGITTGGIGGITTGGIGGITTGGLGGLSTDGAFNGFDTDSLNNFLNGSTNGNMDFGSMISGFMSMIMGFFSSMMGMFTGGNASGGIDFGNVFPGFGGDTTVDGSNDNAEEVEPETPEEV